MQIKDDNNKKNTLHVYKVDSPDGIKVAEGFALENRQYGSGGGRQFFVSTTHRILSEISTDAGAGKTGCICQASPNRDALLRR